MEDWHNEVDEFKYNRKSPVYARVETFSLDSIVTGKVTAYARTTDGLLYDWARVQFFDGEIRNYGWNPVLLRRDDQHDDQEPLWKALPDMGYTVIRTGE